MKRIRYILWAMVAVLAVGMTYLLVTDERNIEKPKLAQLGGAFELTRHDGKSISDKDLLGKPHAIFFGFTSCPEVCPTSLFEISTWLEALGEDADKLGVYFMSVDPQRDTPKVLFEYLTAFDPRIVGITGDKKEMEETLRSYKVFFKRVKLDDGEYTMDHTASIYLMNAQGQFVRSIAYGEDSVPAVAKLRKMLN